MAGGLRAMIYPATLGIIFLFLEKGISTFIPGDEAPRIIQEEEPFPTRERG